MHFIKTIGATLIVCAALLSGCATIQPLRFHSSIDSLAQADANIKKRYVLMPGGKKEEVGDLQFQEFAAYIDKALTANGFVKVNTFQGADVVIFLSYAIGDPQTYQHTYSLPTWGQTGVSSANTYGTVSSYGSTVTNSGVTTYTPTYGVTGSTTQIATDTNYTRFLFLEAYDAATYAKEKKMNQVWKTSVVSIGSSNDLRLVVPYMVTAMKPYLATNTGHKIEVDVLVDDPAVQLLRGGQSSVTK
ncbi:MAG: DUF4136 domain-containing protein [Sulfuriferula sp.]